MSLILELRHNFLKDHIEYMTHEGSKIFGKDQSSVLFNNILLPVEKILLLAKQEIFPELLIFCAFRNISNKL